MLCLVTLIILTTGATQSVPPLSHAQSATVALAHRSGRLFLENLDLKGEVFAPHAQAWQVIVNRHSPKAVVSFMDEAPVDSKHHNRPPPNA